MHNRFFMLCKNRLYGLADVRVFPGDSLNVELQFLCHTGILMINPVNKKELQERDEQIPPI